MKETLEEAIRQIEAARKHADYQSLDPSLTEKRRYYQGVASGLTDAWEILNDLINEN